MHHLNTTHIPFSTHRRTDPPQSADLYFKMVTAQAMQTNTVLDQANCMTLVKCMLQLVRVRAL